MKTVGQEAMDEQQHPQDSRVHAPISERTPVYDEYDIGYEAAMPTLQGGLVAAGASWRDSL